MKKIKIIDLNKRKYSILNLESNINWEDFLKLCSEKLDIK